MKDFGVLYKKNKSNKKEGCWRTKAAPEIRKKRRRQKDENQIGRKKNVFFSSIVRRVFVTFPAYVWT